MTLDESVHGLRLPVIERAQVVGNISAVCWKLGISRTLFYRWRTRRERYGSDGLHRAGCARSRAGRSRRRPRAGDPSWRSRSVQRPGAAAGSPPIWPAPGICAWHPAPCSAAGPRRGRAATATFLRDADLPMPVALSRTGRIRSKDKTEMISQIG